MGIELPAELADVASKAGVSWPQADEDKMRESATAWRDTGDKIKALSKDSDGSASRALDGLTGSTGDAARGHWSRMVAPDGQFAQAARGCHAAADRLDHAATQVGQAKVEIVRELVTLAKNNDAANSAAAAGHPNALLGLDTAVRGTAANVANLSNTLSSAIRLDSGVDMGHAGQPVNTSPGAHGPAGGLLAPVGDVLAPVTQTVAPVTQAVAPVVAPVADAVAPVVAPVTQTVAPVVAPVADTVTSVAQPVLDAAKPVTDTVAPVVQPVADAARPVVDAVPGAQPVVDNVAGKPDHAPADPGRDQGQGPGLVPGLVDKVGTAVQPVVDTVPGIGPDGPPGRGHGDGAGIPSVADRLAGPAVEAVDGRQSLSGTLLPPAAEGTTAASAAALLDRPLLTPDAPHGPQAPAAGPQAPAAQGPAGPALGNTPAPAVGGPAAAPAAAAQVGGVVGQAQGSAAQAGQAAQQAAGRAGEQAGKAAEQAGKAAEQAKQAAGGTGSGSGQAGAAKSDAKAAVGAAQGALGDAKTAADAKNAAAAAASPTDAKTDPKGDLKPDPKADHKIAGDLRADGHHHMADQAVVAQDLGAAGQLPTQFPDHDRQEAIAAALGNPVQHIQAASALGTWFLALVFPFGQLPRLSRSPVRQLPPPAEELDYAAGQRFEPQDHPQSDLVDTGFADRPTRTDGLPKAHPTVQALLDGYDPLGGAHEHDWERRFIVRDEPVEYAWPPAELFPEGGYEKGRPDVLDEGAELDRFGSSEGRVLSQRGTPFVQRSLPPHALDEGYHVYRVLRPLPVWRTVSAPWFGQPGGGARYRTTYPVADLVALGYLMEITA